MSSQNKTIQPSVVEVIKINSVTNKNSDSSDSESEFDNYIGSGGFGKVYEVKGTNLVKKEMDLRYDENIREICFLSTYKHIPFITQLNKFEIDTLKCKIHL